MGRKSLKAKEMEMSESSFLDKTDRQWHVSKKENKVTLCESIDDVINGNGETYKFSRKLITSRSATWKGKEIQKNHFVVFYLVNGDILLLKRWNEMK